MRLSDRQYIALQRIQNGGTLGPREYQLWSGLWRAGLLCWYAKPNRGQPRYVLSGWGERALLDRRLKSWAFRDSLRAA